MEIMEKKVDLSVRWLVEKRKNGKNSVDELNGLQLDF